MKHLFLVLFVFWFLPLFSQNKLSLQGLDKEVEIYIDPFGVPHIYAQTENDLFFAQGFQAASDRLFQFEIWRRQARGLLSEILGEKEIQKDIASRLFKFRGDLVSEFNHYHPHGFQIFKSFVNGVNAAIDLSLENPDSLPIEFRLLGIKPEHVSMEDIISRHQGLLGNLVDEWETALIVNTIGEEKTKELSWFHPGDPSLHLDSLVKEVLNYPDVIDFYKAFKRPISFSLADIKLLTDRNTTENFSTYVQVLNEENESLKLDKQAIGSNNWVVSGNITESGYPMLANDPHRAMAAPSLRYISHLVAPGWNVIGGGEPTIPGISIGHNEYGAWGLTIHSTDSEDMYVYQIHPNDKLKYWHLGKWISMTEIKDSIKLKNGNFHHFSMFYTIHGPVLKIISEKNIAVAVKCAWLEKGGAPYLASLRMNQAKNWDEFKLACSFSHIPGENMIWADQNGNIGWQTVGIAPLRKKSSGLVPVLGDGNYEWEGYLPILERPSSFNPKSNFIVTANENVVPVSFNFPQSVGYSWSDPYRGLRIKEYLKEGKILSVQDFMLLQTDYYSIPARHLISLLNQIPEARKFKKYIELFKDWDYKLEVNSIPATLYDAWERVIFSDFKNDFVPSSVKNLVSPQLKLIINNLIFPDSKFGQNPLIGRNEFMITSFEKAILNVESKLGKDMSNWQYGSLKNKFVHLKHPLSAVVNEKYRQLLEVGPAPRGGNGFTANVTGRSDNQTHGASFRLICDVSDWNNTLAINTPGQSGNPESPLYRNLFPFWLNNQYFPLYFSKEKIKTVSGIHLLLNSK